ncbi:metallohydrolase [Shewanella sp. SM34]|uniref:metallohydrolase n=1 Tax=unclassified Shewanella TaxID=196818 RepID=UPI0021DB65F0|nr:MULTISPECIES: metallohydrolase [unclassified Shewanella]MCU8058410.1 metallohydrolase [Shewanella sp. SM35]MCU8067362.1 metallohydrolase [Shewanella sp. SM34]
MSAKIEFFPVDNGDMTLIRLADTVSTTLLIDINIRSMADDLNDQTPDVAKLLRKTLLTDGMGRPYVDAFLLSHPDKDHCSGLVKHFWLGSVDEYPDDDLLQADKRIIIKEMWSSPMVFRRASKNLTLCDDAKAFNKEARRRVKLWQNQGWAAEGDRILILGEDENGKTDNLTGITIKETETIHKINQNSSSGYFSAKLLAPFPKQDDDEAEQLLSKNHSSVILNIELSASQWSKTPTRFLTGGDAEVAIWERLWEKYKNTPQDLSYDLLQAPHHCSWHTLSYDSWSKYREEAKVSVDARSALGQARDGAIIISSSKKISDDDKDPPCIRAKREYLDILKPVDGSFLCTGDIKGCETIVIIPQNDGSVIRKVASATSAAALITASSAPRAGTHYGVL